MNIEIDIYSTRKRFEDCVSEETAHLATLKSKKYIRNIEIDIYSTRKRFEDCVSEETAHLATLKSKKYIS
jgi:hypothetical protein